MKYETDGNWEKLTINTEGEIDEALGQHWADVITYSIKQRIKLKGVKVETYRMYLEPVGWMGGEWRSYALQLGRNTFWNVLTQYISNSRRFLYNDGRVGYPVIRWYVSEHGWMTLSYGAAHSREEEEE